MPRLLIEKTCTRSRDSDAPASAGASQSARRARQVCRARLNFRRPKGAPRRVAGARGCHDACADFCGAAHPYPRIGAKPLLRLRGSVIPRECAKAVRRIRRYVQGRISGSTNPRASGQAWKASVHPPGDTGAALSCRTSSRRWRLAPSACIADFAPLVLRAVLAPIRQKGAGLLFPPIVACRSRHQGLRLRCTLASWRPSSNPDGCVACSESLRRPPPGCCLATREQRSTELSLRCRATSSPPPTASRETQRMWANSSARVDSTGSGPGRPSLAHHRG
jgi:hypothetical protein